MNKEAFEHLRKLGRYKMAEMDPNEREMWKAILLSTAVGGLAGGGINLLVSKPKHRLRDFLSGALVSGGLSGMSTAFANSNMMG